MAETAETAETAAGSTQPAAQSQNSVAGKPLMEGDELLAHLPHRPPFLFVSRVTRMDDNGITAEFDADPQMDFFNGHFPGNPITPGVILLEAAAQAGVIWMHHLLGERADGSKRLIFAASFDGVRFRRPVLPGETVTIECKIKSVRKRFSLTSFRISAADGSLCAEGTLGAAWKEP
ncbi:MAG: beta-hydroxyacyl-ACP dehydratase [Alphaproteobacteria bacterium]|nr:beta-hydroxyacyl-ACP dehydratase [Alphaproteobacteria bacterium]MDA8000592.1 beta-hydroxyacyl-ACP dehydratase [Alphaproteobacteria bacterium]MDA8003799.1 beta-hydroxyacyl-ACP dehydratase [Alphaproteobacteria bacterium]MDA8005606.1 beta-hydroxyacyl-ACP dehydratase [Alphaproteobacteria bacterium]MDA8012756.1 beta-hydroxyacyl-ACP dehydratase [Alphaproteobacteria bacterium]